MFSPLTFIFIKIYYIMTFYTNTLPKVYTDYLDSIKEKESRRQYALQDLPPTVESKKEPERRESDFSTTKLFTAGHYLNQIHVSSKGRDWSISTSFCKSLFVFIFFIFMLFIKKICVSKLFYNYKTTI